MSDKEVVRRLRERVKSALRRPLNPDSQAKLKALMGVTNAAELQERMRQEAGLPPAEVEGGEGEQAP